MNTDTPTNTDAPMNAGAVVPPVSRSRLALGLTAAAAMGRFQLQTCVECGAVQYPPREACHRCLSVRLQWRQQPDGGELLARTTLFHSNEPYFRRRLPWSIGLIRLDCGPSVIAHLHGDTLTTAGMRVKMALRLDRAGCGVLVALPVEEVSEVTKDMQSKRILVTDAGSATGAALVHALATSGASTIWAGSADTALSFPTLDFVIPLSLDITKDASVAAAASIASEVDILINTAARRADSTSALDSARLDMELYYFGLIRLAREFGPRMRARNHGDTLPASAWVNLLSIHALTGCPSEESFAAAQAAALSLSQSLRAQMLGSGIRVVNVFAGPTEHGPDSLAEEIIAALRSGAEDAYAGDIAKHLFARWRENPKGLERELAAAAGRTHGATDPCRSEQQSSQADVMASAQRSASHC
jgi:NAD(P)-dependent dehydrogenase (short-subunit alcohol dehydrogenase family)/uncharacterized OB-fold protein